MNNATNIILFTKNLITIKLSNCKTYKQGAILFLKKKKKKPRRDNSMVPFKNKNT